MLCVLILFPNVRTYSLKSTPNDTVFEKLFMEIVFDAQSFCLKSAERKKYFSIFLNWNSALASNNLTHYLLHNGVPSTIWCPVIMHVRSLSEAFLKNKKKFCFFLVWSKRPENSECFETIGFSWLVCCLVGSVLSS